MSPATTGSSWNGGQRTTSSRTSISGRGPSPSPLRPTSPIALPSHGLLAPMVSSVTYSLAAPPIWLVRVGIRGSTRRPTKPRNTMPLMARHSPGSVVSNICRVG